jgi:hypothetical protein
MLPWEDVIQRLGIALALGLVVAVLFRLTFGRRKSDAGPMTTTLILLAILIAMMMMVIADNAARAFTLAGTLAIVRFRTVVDDSRDTAFVIFSVVVGMGAGIGSYEVILLGLPVMLLVVGTAAVLARSNGTPVDRTLHVKLAPDKDPVAVQPALAVYATKAVLTGVETQKQSGGLEVIYQVKLRDAAAAVGLVTQLRAVDGVQAVEVKAK